MSKKSRKRNKKILAAIGLGLGAAALASKRKRDANVEMDLPKSDMSNYENEGSLVPAKKAPALAEPAKPVVVDTEPKKIAKRSSRGAGDYGSKTAPIRVNGVLIKGRNNAEMGRTTPFDPAQGNSQKTVIDALRGTNTRGYAGSINYRKDGGRAKLKSGGKVKGCGIAKRGFGKAMKKGKK